MTMIVQCFAVYSDNCRVDLRSWIFVSSSLKFASDRHTMCMTTRSFSFLLMNFPSTLPWGIDILSGCWGGGGCASRYGKHVRGIWPNLTTLYSEIIAGNRPLPPISVSFPCFVGLTEINPLVTLTGIIPWISNVWQHFPRKFENAIALYK